MSALAPSTSYRIFDEPQWLESSEDVDLSPAAVWAPDYYEENEITLPGRRVDVQYIDLTSPKLESEGIVIDGPRQVRTLHESQVLPGEASFATVILNQPLDENVLKPPHSREPIPSSAVGDYREDRPASRVRLLNESQVLDGEASFATILDGGTKVHRHSPLTEFFVKTKLTLAQLVLASSALVLVLALAVIVLVSLTSSQVVTVSSAPPPTTPDTASQIVPTSVASSESALISNAQVEASGSVSPTPVVSVVDEAQAVAEAKLIERPIADDSRKARSIDAKPGAIRREVHPVGARVSSTKERVTETKKPLASVATRVAKEQAVGKTPKVPTVSKPLETRPKPNTQSAVPVTVERVETKMPSTGGGERPRTVTRKPIP